VLQAHHGVEADAGEIVDALEVLVDIDDPIGLLAEPGPDHFRGDRRVVGVRDGVPDIVDEGGDDDVQRGAIAFGPGSSLEGMLQLIHGWAGASGGGTPAALNLF
jgi:hypothetical protein